MWIWFVIYVVGMALTVFHLGFCKINIESGSDIATAIMCVTLWPLFYFCVMMMMLFDWGKENSDKIDWGEKEETNETSSQ
jgi:hypothetical protein